MLEIIKRKDERERKKLTNKPTNKQRRKRNKG